MILRRERQPVEGEAVIRVKDVYGRHYYIDRKKYEDFTVCIIPIYRKYKGFFYRDKKEMSICRGNIAGNRNLIPTCFEYKHYLELAQQYTGLPLPSLRAQYGLYTYGQWNTLLAKLLSEKYEGEK